MKRIATGLGALVLIAACGSGDTDTIEPTLAETLDLILPLPNGTSTEITAEDISSRLKTISDDAFEGRAPGTPGGEGSADWVAAEMQRIGLEPGVDGSYFQTVEMVETTLDTSASGLSISDGADFNKDLEIGNDTVIWSKKQNGTDFSLTDSDLVFVGYGSVAPEYGWDDYAGMDMSGKTVVMLVNDPGYATQDPDLFNGTSMTYYGRWTYKFEEAGRQGADAAIIIHETAPASYGWYVVANSWSGAQADLVRKDGGANRTMMEGWVSIEAATELFEAAGLDLEEMKTAAKTKGFMPVPMGSLKASGEIKQTLENKQSRNVIGVHKGSERPDEYVSYVAHWDHLGKGAGDLSTGDRIFNGAVDNASGTSAILDIAEKITTEQTERSVMFIAVTLEESGLLGSAYYAENPIVPHNQMVAGINIDAMLPMGKTKDVIVIGYGASELEDRLKVLTDAAGRVIVPDQNPQAGYFYRSDHVSLAKKGVPMLYADGGIDKVDGGKDAGRAIVANHTIERYHKPADEFQPDWDFSGMVEDVTMLYDLGLGLANSRDWPEWYDGNEFKAIREASLAEK